jgi:hypothetical protein
MTISYVWGDNVHTISIMVFWVVTPCVFVDRYLRFGETQCLHFHSWRWKQYVAPKHWYLPTCPQGVTTQKTTIDIFTAMRTSNPICNHGFSALGNASDTYQGDIRLESHLDTNYPDRRFSCFSRGPSYRTSCSHTRNTRAYRLSCRGTSINDLCELCTCAHFSVWMFNTVSS